MSEADTRPIIKDERSSHPNEHFYGAGSGISRNALNILRAEAPVFKTSIGG